jgi:transcriptional regulator with XRE-family HTH domain
VISETDPNRFGERLRTARKAALLSQEELGQRLGFSSHYKVSRWEQGHEYPRFWDLIAVAREVHVEAAWLLGSSEEIYTRNGGGKS